MAWSNGQANVIPRQRLPRFRRIGRREGFDLSPGARPSANVSNSERVANRALVSNGERVSSNEWFVVYARRNVLGVSRLGVTVSKRVAPRAVARNFAKRLVRDGFRRSFPAGCAVNVIVRVRRQLDRETSKAASEGLLRLLRGVQATCVKS